MSFAQSFNFDIETKVMGSLYCKYLRTGMRKYLRKCVSILKGAWH